MESMKTKKLFLLLSAAFLLPLLSFAQTTSFRSYFGKEFTHWYTLEAFIVYWGSHSSVVNGDTILSNGIEYKKLCNDYYSRELDGYRQGIREEPETGSLFINKDGNSEVLVSRMDLEIGDKYYFTLFGENFEEYNCNQYHGTYCFKDIKKDEYGYYTTVDSIYYEDGRKHIQFEMILPCKHYFEDIPFTFIEGIGPNISFEPIVEGFSDNFYSCFLCHETESELWAKLHFEVLEK